LFCLSSIDLFAFIPAIKFVSIVGRISTITGYFSAFRGAESAREKDNKANQQNQAKPAAADDGTAEVKSAAAKQEKQNHDD
jgi:hypothetical protein